MPRALACAALFTAACGRRDPAPPAATAAIAPPAPLAVDAAVAAVATSDAGSAAVDAGPRFTPPSQIVALGTWVPVRREPRRDGQLVGYLRAGGVAAVEGMPAGRETCPVHTGHPEGGWYRLTGGGYVCVGGSLSVPWPSRGVRRPAQPMTDAGMPYQYAINYGRSIMYRSLPTADELRVHEPWRYRHDEPDAAAEAPAAGETTASAEPAVPTPAVPTPTPAARREPDRASAAARPQPVETTATPDGEPRLRDLRGDRHGPVIRRLLSGMYVALDRQVSNRETGERYWRTQSGGFVRTGPLSELHTTPTFTGAELDEQHTLPYAFMVSLTGWSYRVSATGRGVSSHRRMPRLTAVQLSADPPIEVGNNRYWRTPDGFAVLERNVRIARLRPPPEGVGPTERWLDVDLDAQVLVAYEGPRPVFATLVSTGRRAEHDPDRNYETPAGTFRIRGKHITTTMDGDTAADGPYSIEDVPWAMYFQDSYALHGAFWHNNFGWRMSHGCVNLSPPDARRVFSWVDPQLPDGWHGVFAGEGRLGSMLVLHHGDQPAPPMRVVAQRPPSPQ